MDSNEPFQSNIGNLTSKSDVYSFGVVLLELLSGRRAVDKNRPNGEHNLVEWARPYLSNKRKIFRILDARFQGQYSLSGAQKAAGLAVRCLSADAKYRPTMDVIVKSLEQLQEMKEMVRNPKIEQGMRRRSMEELGSRKMAYPRPSASPLYA